VARLLLLGPAREAAGTRHDEVEAGTVGEVLAVAVERYGADFERVLEGSQVWLNGSPTGPEQVVGPQDEVAVLPPVSGG
jgi:molybdopterin converting factor small subunit